MQPMPMVSYVYIWQSTTNDIQIEQSADDIRCNDEISRHHYQVPCFRNPLLCILVAFCPKCWYAMSAWTIWCEKARCTTATMTYGYIHFQFVSLQGGTIGWCHDTYEFHDTVILGACIEIGYRGIVGYCQLDLAQSDQGVHRNVSNQSCKAWTRGIVSAPFYLWSSAWTLLIDVRSTFLSFLRRALWLTKHITK